VARGDVNSITIGRRTNIQDGSILHATHDGKFRPGGFPLIIGDGVTVGHRVTLHACTVGDYCLIGMSATIIKQWCQFRLIKRFGGQGRNRQFCQEQEWHMDVA
jgi:Carbonic anhydrases/acetyltransferases, isoleucine patch superfamily